MYNCGNDRAGSSLWEIDTLRHHYSPPVSRYVLSSTCPHLSHYRWLMYPSHVIRFALSLVNDLAVRSRLPEVAVSDFSSGSYVTIFGDEVTNLNHMTLIIRLSLLGRHYQYNCYQNLTDKAKGQTGGVGVLQNDSRVLVFWAGFSGLDIQRWSPRYICKTETRRFGIEITLLSLSHPLFELLSMIEFQILNSFQIEMDIPSFRFKNVKDRSSCYLLF